MTNPNKKFYVYLIRFSTGKIKIGVTGNLSQRLKYYHQEMVRHCATIETYQVLAKFDEKISALWLERNLCKFFNKTSITREWFCGEESLFSRIESYSYALCEILRRRKEKYLIKMLVIKEMNEVMQ